MLSIGITTFARRFDLLKRLIKDIRGIDKDIEIIVTINADYQKEFDEQYRSELCSFLSQVNNCFPIFFPSFTSLSKMWNTLIIHSSNEHILILNDDINFNNEQIIAEITNKISARKGKIDPYCDLFTINKSWSYFVISKEIAHKLKYFDERLLAFGEEDGDMVWRFIKEFGFKHENIEIDGLKNIGEGYEIRPANLNSQEACGAFRPIFNREQLYKRKYKKAFWGIKGMFDYKCIKILNDVQQYPYEEFKRANINKL